MAWPGVPGRIKRALQGRSQMSTTKNEVLLQADKLTRRFGGLVANQDISVTLERQMIHVCCSAPTARASRPASTCCRATCRRPRAHPLPRQGTSPRLPRRSARRHRRSYQRTNIFPQFTVLENVRLAAQSPPAAVEPVPARPWSRSGRWRSARACIEESRPGQARRLGVGRAQPWRAKRQLEIAMVLATDAQVLLLDEPLAGMGSGGVSEHGRGAQAPAPDRGILLVEHDMDAVFAVADMITVMVNGQLLECGPPAQIKASVASSRPIWVRRTSMSNMLLEAKEIQPTTVQPHPARHRLQHPRRRGHRPHGPQRHGQVQSTLIKHRARDGRSQTGQVLVRGDDYTRRAPFQTAQRGHRTCRRARHLQSLTVRENLLMSARAGVDGRREWTFDRVMETFPRLGERINNGGWQLSGGEQQMLTIGRALMTNRPADLGRGHWRASPADRDGDLAHRQGDPQDRHRHRDQWTRNHGAVTSICDRAMILVKGQVVFDGTSDEIRAQPELIQKHLGV